VSSAALLSQQDSRAALEIPSKVGEPSGYRLGAAVWAKAEHDGQGVLDSREIATQ
jgi:hypothetical protein